MNTSEILTRAADLIDKRGHNKGAYRSDAGALCARGAIVRAVSPRYSFRRNRWIPLPARQATAALQRYLGRAREGWWAVGVTGWNDAPERTKEEVVTALRGAAEAARADQ